MNKKILVTGGCGFIGSNLIRYIINHYDLFVCNLDKLTYAGNQESLNDICSNKRYRFVQGDIGDRLLIRNLLTEIRPYAVLNLAAESHVDRSIDGPEAFIQTNIVGTFHLLDEVRFYWNSLSGNERNDFRFLHVSTDEVFGSLKNYELPFTETHPYSPNSPYAASKASSDHLIKSYDKTYGLPVLITNCSNNYGPFQFPEKLIPLMILNCISEKKLPVYGSGENVRDWLYVEDHCRAIMTVLMQGVVGEKYNIGGDCEKRNIEIVRHICKILNERIPRQSGSYEDLITFVQDRPGHDFRYAMDSTKIKSELNWRPFESFETGLKKTVDWYLENMKWSEMILSGKYQMQRLGLSS